VIKWFGNPTRSARQAMRDGEFGAVITPAQGMYKDLDGVELIVDNGKFGQGYPGDVQFLAFVAKMPADADIRFVVAPDVVGDAAATLKMSAPFLPVIRAMGHRVALAAQNGLTSGAAPWDDFDVLFLGGVAECLPCGWVKPATEKGWKFCPQCCRPLTEWKTSETAVVLARAAAGYGKDIHMGRVNGPERLAIAEAMGCSTADGTLLVFGPETNLPRVRKMIRAVNNEQMAFEESA
jgi:hypothetical protein